jgi:hypothetical protein
MKKLITFLAVIATIATFAQAPQGFNYQATVRNSTGALIVNQNVNFKFNVMLNSATSLPVFSETHMAPTDELGQVNLVIGQGTATVGTFSTINWGTGNYYLGIELNTGGGYIAMGTTQLLSVPYALYANSSGNTIGNSGGFTHYIGELFGGGIVVSVWKTNGVEHGLIASLVNLSTGLPWTTPNFETISVSGTGALNPQDGLANTNAIVAQVGIGTNYAAGLCKAFNAGGFNDWYLPALWELNQCYNAVPIINAVLGNTNGFQFTRFNSSYWSSTEGDSNFAFQKSFFDGSTNYSLGSNIKLNNLNVRAVRKY